MSPGNRFRWPRSTADWKRLRPILVATAVGIAVGASTDLLKDAVRTGVEKLLGDRIKARAERQRTQAEQDIRELIAAEATLALKYPHGADDTRRYEELFTENAWMVDVRHQLVWAGRGRIAERFSALHFASLEHNVKDIQVRESGALAEANTNTVFEIAGRRGAFITDPGRTRQSPPATRGKIHAASSVHARRRFRRACRRLRNSAS